MKFASGYGLSSDSAKQLPVPVLAYHYRGLVAILLQFFDKSISIGMLENNSF